MRLTLALLARPAGALALALAVTLSLPSPHACADASGAQDTRLTMDALMTRFRAIVGLSARYREEKRISLLAQPLVSEGTVHYAPPARIARHTLTPSPSSVVLDGGTLRLWDGVTEQSIDVTASPAVRAFADSFLAVLAGDRATLDRTFVVDFRAIAGQKWELTLVPRDPSLGSILRDVRFAGEGIVIAQMRIREATGDETVTTFLDVDTAHRYTDAEAARVFRLRK
jgi:outer membrane lipoprotein-sorting protein